MNDAGKRKLKLSIVSMNLSTNCTNRCVRIAEALSGEYEVEIVGTTFGVGTRWGEGLWPPLEGVSIPIRAVRGGYLPGYLKSIRALLSAIDGDVIIACKPRFPSLGVALIKKVLSGKPVILDVDDDELAQTLPGKRASLPKQLINTGGYLFTRMTHPFWKFADGIFTVSEHFRNTYGGVIVSHGRDPDELNPAKYDRTKIRNDLNIDVEDTVIGFVGSPQQQKGIDLILEAIRKLNNEKLKLMIVGAEDNDAYLASLKQQYGSSMMTVTPQPIEKIPYYLTAIDLVVLPQRKVPESLGQMPAKLTDAMAMAKPVIASGLADIPLHLEGRGLIVEPGNLDDLARAIEWVLDNRQDAQEMGMRAREYFLEKLTLAAMLTAMRPEIERTAKRMA